MKHLIAALVLAGVLVGSAFAQVNVRGYYRSNGTYVQPYVRTAPDSTPTNNYSYPGNYNPNTGSITGGNSYSYPSYSTPAYSGFGNMNNRWSSGSDDY